MWKFGGLSAAWHGSCVTPCMEPRLVQQKRVAMFRPKLISIFAGAAMLASSGAAHATLITFTGSGTNSGDPTQAVDASAQFTTSGGSISVILTNTLAPSDLRSAGQAISDLAFTLSTAPGTQGALTAAGQQGNVTGTTPGTVSFVSGSPNRFIGQGPGSPNGVGSFTVTGNTIMMEALGGGAPTQLILPAVADGGTYANSNASIAGLDPSTIGPATFTLAFTGVTDSTTDNGRDVLVWDDAERNCRARHPLRPAGGPRAGVSGIVGHRAGGVRLVQTSQVCLNTSRRR